MKQLVIMLLLLAAGSNIYAQGQPLYICDTNKPNITNIVPYWMPFDMGDNLSQALYYKSDFMSMPAQGFITDIFLKISSLTPSGSTLPGLTVKMGITTRKNFDGMSDAHFLAMDAALTTVYYDSFYVLPGALQAGSWWKLSLPQPYQYSLLPLPGDTSQNLIVQLSKSVYNNSGTQNHRFHLFEIVYNGNIPWRFARARKNDVPGQIVGWTAGNISQLIGFNGYALSVDDPQKKIPFSVFPNPATDKLHVSKEASGVYEVYDLRGVKVAASNIKEGEEVNVQSLAPGIYMLKMGERTTRFVKE
ncbi:MAG TPA: T9SS type A sorting domain-containing protein [Flavipsychrobacter sp.]|nr:T9SS type A sorting domain-containing protein [Flavipsychrobacter sp.]